MPSTSFLDDVVQWLAEFLPSILAVIGVIFVISLASAHSRRPKDGPRD